MSSAADVGSGLRRATRRGRNWIKLVRSGDALFFSSAAGEPATLIDQFVDAASAGSLPSVTAYQMLRGGGLRLRAAASEKIKIIGLTAGEMGDAIERGVGSFLPLGIYQLAQAIASRQLRFDVAVVQTSPPDRRGYLSLGVSVDFAADVVRNSRTVIAEINERAPRTLGNSAIHISEITAAVEVSRDLPETRESPIDDVARDVGRQVVELVSNGATIEIGVGSVMSAVLESLKQHRDLGLHTGLLTDPMVPLIEAGVISNRRKARDRGLSVANQARGTRRLYDFIHDNPGVSMQPATYTHSPIVLQSLVDFHAINAAIEVDLLGQANCEFVKGVRHSSVGGLLDFVRAGRLNDGARSIVVLKSTDRGGSISRIVPRLDAGQGVTVTADLADMVVTEHGFADLRTLDVSQRRKALIAIAHPRHREDLARTS
jgi:4-hydroxybutyrate CoA-transferase